MGVQDDPTCPDSMGSPSGGGAGVRPPLGSPAMFPSHYPGPWLSRSLAACCRKSMKSWRIPRDGTLSNECSLSRHLMTRDRSGCGPGAQEGWVRPWRLPGRGGLSLRTGKGWGGH